MSNKLNFFYRVDSQGYPVPGSLQRFKEKPINGRWQQLDYNNICCIPDPEPEPEPIPEQTITFNYLTPLPGIAYRVHLIGEDGNPSQGYYTSATLDENNTSTSLIIPQTGTYTVILEIMDAEVDCTITLSNSGIVGFKDISALGTYVAFGRDLTAVTVMNSVTPCA
jgi:hypothetical protein